ncbi:MAG: carboxypeptidase-like regulatory domain-containing protein [Armatimonadota bacterium]
MRAWIDGLTGTLLGVVLLGPACAGISYDPGRDCIMVVGFPEEQPATMDAVLAADRENAWGKVMYDAASDTYTVDADLWIGDDQSNGTFLQMGDAKHPKVTVVVRGTVWVRPPRESTRRSDGLYSIINRLTLGDADDENIRATLKIDCEAPGEHGLYVGYRLPGGAVVPRGSLRAYNSTITAARQDEEHVWGTQDYTDEESSPRWAAPAWYASDVRLINATISWFEKCVAYGSWTGEWGAREPVDAMRPNPLIRIEGTTFEHGEFGVKNARHYLRNCVFRDLDIAVGEGGALSAKLVNCSFEGNERNWTLGSLYTGGIVMLDCAIGPQTEPITIKKNNIEPEEAARRGLPIYPACRVRESLLLKVVDSEEAPVPDAIVVVSCREEPEQVTRGATVTDENGWTPADPESSAIVVTVKRYRATDVPNEPEVTTFTYDIAITAPGFQPKTLTLPARHPIPRPVVVPLERE